jgi:hypothetical protein
MFFSQKRHPMIDGWEMSRRWAGNSSHRDSKGSAILNLGVFFSSKNKRSPLQKFGFLENPPKKQSRKNQIK